MKTDGEIGDDVIEGLRWDPQITDPDAIGVAVKDGAVILAGSVPTYVQKLAAARAAERVYGVKAVANELEVKLLGGPRGDSDIATAIAHVLENNVQVPEGKVHARVENGCVALDGEVDYDYQRREVERMVRQVRGVVGSTDTITVRPPASPAKVQQVIEETFNCTGTCTPSRRRARPGRQRPRRPGSPRWITISWSPPKRPACRAGGRWISPRADRPRPRCRALRSHCLRSGVTMPPFG
jgi:osmotically-inducible protein OsmY